MKNEKNTKDKDVEQSGSNVPVEVRELPILGEGADSQLGAAAADAGEDNIAAGLSAGAFTTYFTWRGNGTVKALRFSHPSITANSRVFVSLSEYSSTPTQRFIGDCRMNVYNVAPFAGGFAAWVEVPWSYPLNVRFDVFVDP